MGREGSDEGRGEGEWGGRKVMRGEGEGREVMRGEGERGEVCVIHKGVERDAYSIHGECR